MNLGGAPIPVLDLARLLGKRDGASDTNPYRHVLLDTDGALALLVDRVTDVVRVPVDQIGPVDGERTLNGCVEAEITLGGRLVHVLSMERLLTLEERERIAAFRQRAADRLAALDTAAID
jgi:purine-binding chemotaxis protein CheW